MNSELWRRIGFTVAALLVYRFGSYVPLPGLDVTALAALFGDPASAALPGFGVLAGGNVRRFAVFTLGIAPYLSAALLIQLALLFSARLRSVQAGGYAGRRRLRAWTLGLTLVLAALQAYGIALGLQALPHVVTAPGPLFALSSVVTLAGGSLFLVWLSEQITARGIGNGIAMILFAGIAVEVPGAIAATLDLGRRGVISDAQVLALALLAVAVTALIVFIEGARRRLPVTFAADTAGPPRFDRPSFLEIKLNPTGFVPALLASWLLAVPIAVGAFADPDGWLGLLAQQFTLGRPLYFVLYAVLIVFCAFVYSALILDPERTARDLAARGARLGGIAAGADAAIGLDRALSPVILLGGVYLAAVCLVPELLIAKMAVPFYFGGISLLIAVCTVRDLRTQVQHYAVI